MNDALFECDEALIRSSLNFPRCRCGAETCPDSAPAGEKQHQDDEHQDHDSPTLLDLRARVREGNARRRYGR
ncbi:hypothetical protein [Streptomyces sp. A1-5]|uniref:hypothetical protein n=1 Tax=Streptomyces sp. A1-5 TaxID=2738410 RepID=UPI001F2533AC|nr:hypothetical protein [Streptomyces sp. A1-5]UJB43622.1 hypothetical protein HRD51_25010 [Streptomyces sp. A1-5]